MNPPEKYGDRQDAGPTVHGEKGEAARGVGFFQKFRSDVVGFSPI
jgi:hypothetical protein